MSSTISRLILPAIISVAGVVVTQMWYMKASKITFVKAIGQPIAVLQQRSDRVERRPTTRLIWQDVDQGETLFSGEAVRTTAKASGRIQFIQSGVTVGLEPDSLVVIEETNGNVALNLVNGGVFVKSEGASESGKNKKNDNLSQPVIKAGSKTISLTDNKSELNLSLSESGQASLVVNKGNVAVTSNTGTQKETLKAGDSKALSTTASAPATITIILPRPNTVLPISIKSSAMMIEWKPDSTLGLLTLEMGTTRDQLSPVGATFSGSIGRATIQAKSGGFFWRLISKDKNGKILAQSPTIYNEGLALEAPKLLTNANGERILGTRDNSTFTANLAWVRPQSSESTTLTIASDKEFKNIVEAKNFPIASEWSFSTKKPGPYYWNVRANWRGISTSLTSTTGSFIIAQQQEVATPTPQTSKAPDVAKLDTSSITANPQILAVDNTVRLTLGSIPKNTVRLRFRLASAGKSLDQSPWLQGLPTGQLVAKVKAAGVYQLQAEALEKDEHVLARSEVISFTVKLPDLLQAPELLGKASQIKTNGSGNADIRWTSVKGAASYTLILSGPKPRTFRVNRTTQLAIPGLLPGTYKLIVRAIDDLGRPGEPSKEFSVIVPSTNELEGPKAKSIKIRD